ncbi:MAG: TRAP transporter small permease [Candidatus Methylomirabilales bacterium]
MLTKLCDGVARTLQHVLVALGVILIAAVTLLVAARYVPGVPRWLWPLEIANWAMIWMVFVGASLALRQGMHFNVDLFMGKTPARGVHVFLRLVYFVFVGFVTLTFIFFGYGFLTRWAMIQTSEILMVNMAFLYVSVPVAGLLWLLFLVEDFSKEFLLPRQDSRGTR